MTAQAIESLEDAAKQTVTDLRIALATDPGNALKDLKALIDAQGRGKARIRIVVPTGGNNGGQGEETEILLRGGVALTPGVIAAIRAVRGIEAVYEA